MRELVVSEERQLELMRALDVALTDEETTMDEAMIASISLMARVLSRVDGPLGEKLKAADMCHQHVRQLVRAVHRSGLS